MGMYHGAPLLEHAAIVIHKSSSTQECRVGEHTWLIRIMVSGSWILFSMTPWSLPWGKKKLVAQNFSSLLSCLFELEISFHTCTKRV